jgi:hypothetical protein
MMASRALEAALLDTFSPADNIASLTSSQASAAVINKARTFLTHRRGYAACVVYMAFVLSISLFVGLYIASDSAFVLREAVDRTLFPDDLMEGVADAWLLPELRLRERGFASKWLRHVSLPCRSVSSLPRRTHLVWRITCLTTVLPW